MGAPAPPFIPEPFANLATVGSGPGNRTSPIPDTTTNNQAASWSLGFQPITMQPVVAGGKPPLGQDVNGVLFAITAHNFFVQAGALFPYSAAVSTAIGGYGLGTILGSIDGRTVWYNTLAGNTTDPDSGGAANWISLYTYGVTTKNGLTGGAAPLTLTNSEAARQFIFLNGTLTANLTVVLPANQQDWLVINNTTGAFTTTVKTPAGTGVVVPQGGPSNPVGVYSDGVNMYPVIPASALVPADQNATPLTLAERTNAGYLLATYFNQSSPLENPSVGAVFVQNNAGDGYLRKISLANFEAQLALSSIGGSVTNGQVPSGAVLQYAAAILANAALTGTPTAPTAAAGTSSTQVATTAFANPGVVVNGNGVCINFPNGYKLQMGTCNPAGGTAAVTFPVAFTASVFPVAISMAGAAVQTWLPSATPPTLAGMHVSNSGGSSFWIAAGL